MLCIDPASATVCEVIRLQNLNSRNYFGYLVLSFSKNGVEELGLFKTRKEAMVCAWPLGFNKGYWLDD